MDISKDFKKNSNDFSFTREVINEVINLDFKSGSKTLLSALSSDAQPVVTKDNYIWYALSATSEDVGEALYQNVLNYMQNVADIDTCTIKALQSMAQILGTKYSILESFDTIPLEIQNLVDIFSMRKDCLLDSSLMSKHSLTTIVDGRSLSTAFPASSYISASTLEVLNECSAMSAGTLYGQISAKYLDELISSTYLNVLSANVSLTYGRLTNDRPIYEILSDCILKENFQLPNKNKDKIDKYKTKWNIPDKFDPEEELDKIHSGISTYDDYNNREQELLDIELAREEDAYIKLEPTTRYAYFNEKKVKEYFQFIENWYNGAAQKTFFNISKYSIDETYVEVSLSSQELCQLLSSTNAGVPQLNETMLSTVAFQLLDLTKQLRDLREYLKSNAQRTYMKGTFLLLSYIVNEYLKQNLYPTAQLIHSKYPALASLSGETNWDKDDNTLELVEYVDQTQYYNIKSDDVDKDKLQFGESTSKRAKSLNSQFWKDGSTNTGNASFIDTTNIFHNEDKSKLVTGKSFAIDQIADFYENTLMSMKDKELSSGRNKRVHDFLSTVFRSGADSTWWNDDTKKVVAILKNGKSTQEIEDYMSSLNSCYNNSQYILSGFEPIEGTTLEMQISAAAAEYLNLLRDKYFNLDFTMQLSIFDEQLEKIQAAFNQLEELKEDFDNYKSRLDTFIDTNMQYTEDFVKDEDSIYEQQIASDHYDYISKIVDQTIRQKLVDQNNDYQTIHSSLTTRMMNLLKTFDIIGRIELDRSKIQFIDGSNETDEIEFKVGFITEDANLYKYIDDICKPNKYYFELMYSSIIDKLQSLQIYLTTEKANNLIEFNNIVEKELNGYSVAGLAELSAKLDEYDFLGFTWSIKTCVDDISSYLAYEDDPWYKYKKKLFLKYTGQEVGDTPYYYAQNSVHPSYQIHPCLSNFIENVDYSYPIQNLAGIADDILNQEMTKMIDDKVQRVQDFVYGGYLKNIWKNPLNSNQDYLTRYEKADHYDSQLSINQYFGWDGFIHPNAVVKCFASNNSLKSFSAISSQVVLGQNYSNYDIEQLSNELCASADLLSCALGTPSADIDIKQYGLDIYGNSYILLRQKTPNNNQLSNILWFRRKNAPIPTLAFVESTNNQYLSSAFQKHDYSNTAMFNSNKKVKILFNNNNLFTPTFDDFTISPDKTAIYLRNGDDIIFVDILQQFVDDQTYVGYKRYALQDRTTRLEHFCPKDLTSNNASESYFKAWYFQNQTVGAIYAQRNNSTISVEVVKRYNTSTRKEISHTISSTILNGMVTSIDEHYACDAEGNIGIAYIRQLANANSLTTPFNTTTTNTALASYIDLLSNRAVAIKNLIMIGDSLYDDSNYCYNSYSDTGFALMPVTQQNQQKQTIAIAKDTSYSKQLLDNGFLKVQLAIPSSNVSCGIDFRRVCPIRVKEDSNITANDNTTYHYNYDNHSIASLSGAVLTYKTVHFLESVYNQYIQQETDEQWYELVDDERLGRKHPDSSKDAGDFDYLQLAHYDVIKYLSALKCEEQNEELDIISGSLSTTSLIGIVQPYMMQDNKTPLTYLSGFYCQQNSGTANSIQYARNGELFGRPAAAFSTNINTCILKVADENSEDESSSEISVNWIYWKNQVTHDYQVKLDFNTPLYLSANINSILGVDVSKDTNSKFNERNKRNLFLNLDRPGEAGILNIYQKAEGTNMPAFKSMWYIKNISEGQTPKFLMKSVVDTSPTESQIVAFQKLSMKASVDGDNSSMTLIATEDPILKYVAFE